MLHRIGVPLIIIAAIALIFLLMVIWNRNRQRENERRERILAEEQWNGVCRFDNPLSGAKCSREEFHMETHYREVGGKLVFW